jgi:high-affinity Fe2+/Pb2+ permease
VETIGYLDLIGLTGLLVIVVGGLFAIGAWYQERRNKNEKEKTACEDNSDSDSGDPCWTE